MKYSRYSKSICRLFFLSSLATCFFGMSMSSVADAPQRADESNSEAVARRFRAEDRWKPDVKALLNVDFHRAVRNDEAYRLVKYNSLATFPSSTLFLALATSSARFFRTSTRRRR